MNKSVILTRDCPAIRIPSGESIQLKKDQEVGITQALGGSFTVVTNMGMARVAAADADALGIDPETIAGLEEQAAPKDLLTGQALIDEVWKQLKTVYDPEIPVNIVDLGLVYSMEVLNDGKRVEVDMTLTAPGCGMGPTIQADAQSRILAIAGIEEAEVRLVWEPAWNQDMITEHGKMKLGMI